MATSFSWDSIQDEATRLAFINPKTTIKIGKRNAWYPSDDFEDQIWAQFVYRRLQNVFNKNQDEIFGSGRKPFCAIKCYMTSPSTDWKQARPTVVVSSTKPKYAQKTIAVLAKSPIILRLDSGFDFYADPRADDAIRCSGADILYPPDFSSDQESLCGVRILVAPLPGSSSSQLRQATLGGIVQIDNAYYGLTAAHAFSGPADAQSDATEDSDHGSSDSALSTSAPRSSTESLTNIAHSQTGIVYIDPAVYYRRTDDSGNHFFAPHSLSRDLLPDHVLGQLHEYNSPNPGLSRSNDWAIIRITDPRFRQPNTFALGERVVQCGDVATTIPRGEVALLAGFSGITLRQSYRRTAGILLPGAQGMVSAWTIEGSALPGDCGSWIVDSTNGSVYGMLVASSKQQNCSYCLPMSEIFDSILSVIGTRPAVFKSGEAPVESNGTPVLEVTSATESEQQERAGNSEPDHTESSPEQVTADGQQDEDQISRSVSNLVFSSSTHCLASDGRLDDADGHSSVEGTQLQAAAAAAVGGTVDVQRLNQITKDDKLSTKSARAGGKRVRKRKSKKRSDVNPTSERGNDLSSATEEHSLESSSGTKAKSNTLETDSGENKDTRASVTFQEAVIPSSSASMATELGKEDDSQGHTWGTPRDATAPKDLNADDKHGPGVSKRGPSCYEIPINDIDKEVIRGLGYGIWVGDASSIIETYGEELRLDRLLGPGRTLRPLSHPRAVSIETVPDREADIMPSWSRAMSTSSHVFEESTVAAEDKAPGGIPVNPPAEAETVDLGYYPHTNHFPPPPGQLWPAPGKSHPQEDDPSAREITVGREPEILNGTAAAADKPEQRHREYQSRRDSVSSYGSSVDSRYGKARKLDVEEIVIRRFDEQDSRRQVYHDRYDQSAMKGTSLVPLTNDKPNPRLSSTMTEEIVVRRSDTNADAKSGQPSIHYVWDQDTGELVIEDRSGLNGAARELLRIRQDGARTKQHDEDVSARHRQDARHLEGPKPPTTFLPEEEELLKMSERMQSRRPDTPVQQGSGYSHPSIEEHRVTERSDSQKPRSSVPGHSQTGTEPGKERLDTSRDVRDSIATTDVQQEADYYNAVAMKDAYVKEAYDGATVDWGMVDIPPGTVRVVLRGGRSEHSSWRNHCVQDPKPPPDCKISTHEHGVPESFEIDNLYTEPSPDWTTIGRPPATTEVVLQGVGGARQIITWQRFNGVRRSEFFPDQDTPLDDEKMQSKDPNQAPIPGRDSQLASEGPFPRYGKTRMPKRLIETNVLDDLGYTYHEENNNTILVAVALGQEQIDQVLTMSKQLREGEGRKDTAQAGSKVPPAQENAPASDGSRELADPQKGSQHRSIKRLEVENKVQRLFLDESKKIIGFTNLLSEVRPSSKGEQRTDALEFENKAQRLFLDEEDLEIVEGIMSLFDELWPSDERKRHLDATELKVRLQRLFLDEADLEVVPSIMDLFDDLRPSNKRKRRELEYSVQQRFLRGEDMKRIRDVTDLFDDLWDSIKRERNTDDYNNDNGPSASVNKQGDEEEMNDIVEVIEEHAPKQPLSPLRQQNRTTASFRIPGGGQAHSIPLKKPSPNPAKTGPKLADYGQADRTQQTQQTRWSGQPKSNTTDYQDECARLVREYRINALQRGLSLREIQDVIDMLELEDKESKLAKLRILNRRSPPTKSALQKEVSFATVLDNGKEKRQDEPDQTARDHIRTYYDEDRSYDNRYYDDRYSADRYSTGDRYYQDYYSRGSERAEHPRRPPAFLREDYGRFEAGPLVLRAAQREDDVFDSRPRRQLSPEPRREFERESIIIRRDDSRERRSLPSRRSRARSREREEIIIRRGKDDDARPMSPKPEKKSGEEIDVIVRRDDRRGPLPPPIPQREKEWTIERENVNSLRRRNEDAKPGSMPVIVEEVITHHRHLDHSRRSADQRKDRDSELAKSTTRDNDDDRRSRSRSRRDRSVEREEIIIRRREDDDRRSWSRSRERSRDREEIIIRRTNDNDDRYDARRRDRSVEYRTANSYMPPSGEASVDKRDGGDTEHTTVKRYVIKDDEERSIYGANHYDGLVEETRIIRRETDT